MNTRSKIPPFLGLDLASSKINLELSRATIATNVVTLRGVIKPRPGRGELAEDQDFTGTVLGLSDYFPVATDANRQLVIVRTDGVFLKTV